MKYLKQLLIILAVSFIGELLNHFIPLPIPAGIYGIVLLFLLLETKLLPLSSVREAGKFLIEIMPVMFVPITVKIMESWDMIKASWIAYLTVPVVTTVLVMFVAGRVTQAVIRRTKKGGNT